jgi:hypothetical protein
MLEEKGPGGKRREPKADVADRRQRMPDLALRRVRQETEVAGQD